MVISSARRLLIASLTASDWFGLVGAIAGTVTVFAGIGTYLYRWREYRRLLVYAAYENAHNLQHFAQCYDGRKFASWPDFHTPRTAELLKPPFAWWTSRHQELAGACDHLVRNHEFLQRYSFTTSGLDEAQRVLGWSVEHMIRFLLHARSFRGARRLLNDLGLSTWLSLRDVHVRLTLSEAEEDISERKHGAKPGVQLLVWVGSSGPDSADDAWKSFREMQDPPPRGTVPELHWWPLRHLGRRP